MGKTFRRYEPDQMLLLPATTRFIRLSTMQQGLQYGSGISLQTRCVSKETTCQLATGTTKDENFLYWIACAPWLLHSSTLP